MSLEPPPVGPARSIFYRLGALVLIGVVLTHLKAILVPLVLATLVAFLLNPLVAWQVGRGVPGVLAIVSAEVAATLPVIGVFLVFSATVGPLQEALPKYQSNLKVRFTESTESLLERFVEDVDQRERVRGAMNKSVLDAGLNEGAEVLSDSVTALTTATGYFLLTLLISAFMLVEGRQLREKFGAAFGENHPVLDALGGIGRDVRAYVVAKTLISALTGVCVWLFLSLCGVDFAVFWGLVAFPLNFIPTVGAAVASIPPILVAVVDPEMSTWGAVGITVGLLSINGIIGSVLDPRFVGQAVKLSPLVVLVSMLVWAAVWGPVGMILAVPIMVSVKVVCARIPALEPVAILLRG